MRVAFGKIFSALIVGSLATWTMLLIHYTYTSSNFETQRVATDWSVTDSKAPIDEHTMIDIETTAVTMCGGRHHLRLLIGQIRYWQKKFDLENNLEFYVCHVGELTESESSSILSLPRTHVLDLLEFFEQHGNQLEDVKAFTKGFRCKGICLAHVLRRGYTQLVFADIDLVLFQNPLHVFDLMVPQQNAIFMVRDIINYGRRRFRGGFKDYLKKELANILPPSIGSRLNASKELRDNYFAQIQWHDQMFVGDHFTDSSMVWFKPKFFKNLTNYIDILITLNSPRFQIIQHTYTYGDKETYWIGALLLNESIQFSGTFLSYFPVESDIRDADGKAEKICGWKGAEYMQVQYSPLLSVGHDNQSCFDNYTIDGQDIMWLGGDHVEKLLQKNQHENFSVEFVSKRRFFPPLLTAAGVDGGNFCFSDDNSLREYVINNLQVPTVETYSALKLVKNCVDSVNNVCD